MGDRVLIPLVSCALAWCALSACHDWSAFEEVPEPAQSTSGTSPGPGIDAGSPDGKSSPAPSGPEFAQLGEKPTLVAGDAQGIVFLTTLGSVLTCPHEGCALPAVIAANQKDARSLTVGFGFVAWVARGDQAVRRTSRTPGSGRAESVQEPHGLLSVALTPSMLYFSVDGSNDLIRGDGIRRCTPGLDCQVPATQFDGFAFGHVTELRLDGADSYWLGDDGVYGCPIAACNEDDGRRVTLAKDPVLPFALGLDDDAIFYGSTLEGGSIRTLPRSAIKGGAVPSATPIATKLGAPSRLVVTSNDVWFVDPVGIVGKISKTTGAATTVATGLAAPTGITAGGGWIYVTCAGDGRILRWRE